MGQSKSLNIHSLNIVSSIFSSFNWYLRQWPFT